MRRYEVGECGKYAHGCNMAPPGERLGPYPVVEDSPKYEKCAAKGQGTTDYLKSGGRTSKSKQEAEPDARYE